MPQPFEFQGDRLRALREGRDMSLVDLGTRLYEVGAAKRPMPRQAIQQWEAGITAPRGTSLTGLCIVFGVAAEYFYGIEAVEPEPAAA